jgi:ATP-dependent protease HslVU (ClpYQ) ATPase subunit
MSRKSEPKTKGTAMSERTRKKANTLSDEQRHELMGKALAMIYKGGDGKACVSRR